LSVDDRVRLLASVHASLEQLGALELNVWTAVAALSCAERLLSEEASSDAFIVAISARVAERAGVELPQLAKATPASRRGAA